jgi:hypothetical protein
VGPMDDEALHEDSCSNFPERIVVGVEEQTEK